LLSLVGKSLNVKRKPFSFKGEGLSLNRHSPLLKEKSLFFKLNSSSFEVNPLFLKERTPVFERWRISFVCSAVKR
jgi:hypothetical protein